jgi:hypothetical protein
MSILNTQKISEIGLNPVYTSAGVSGDKIEPSRRTFVHVKNNSVSSSTTVTVVDTLSIEPAGSTCFDPDLSVVIEPGGNRMIGPIVETRYKNASGYTDVSYTNAASVVVAVIEV